MRIILACFCSAAWFSNQHINRKSSESGRQIKHWFTETLWWKKLTMFRCLFLYLSSVPWRFRSMLLDSFLHYSWCTCLCFFERCVTSLSASLHSLNLNFHSICFNKLQFTFPIFIWLDIKFMQALKPLSVKMWCFKFCEDLQFKVFIDLLNPEPFKRLTYKVIFS